MRDDKKTALKTIKVKRERLLETLKKNLATHETNLKAAMKGYKDQRSTLAKQVAAAAQAFAADRSHENLNDLQSAVKRVFSQDKPASRVSDYESAIAIADWTTGKQIELSIHDFNCYVLDKWLWSEGFGASVRNYSGGLLT